MNIELFEQLKTLETGENVVVTVNEDITNSMLLLNFQLDSLELAVQSVKENRYGFYSKDSEIKLLERIGSKRLEIRAFLNNVGKTLLGENYREILNELGVEFRIDLENPVIIFFKVGK